MTYWQHYRKALAAGLYTDEMAHRARLAKDGLIDVLTFVAGSLLIVVGVALYPLSKAAVAYYAWKDEREAPERARRAKERALSRIQSRMTVVHRGPVEARNKETTT